MAAMPVAPEAQGSAPEERVLDLIQSGFPLAPDPYGAMGRQLGLSRAEVLEAVTRLRAAGTIRRLGASFDSKKLGYASTLCALAVPGDEAAVNRVAQLVNTYPNVTHNYLRANCYNLWFTIIAPGAGEAARILAEITERSGCADALNLPATALYKIRVDFSELHKGGVVSEEAGAASERVGAAPATPAPPEGAGAAPTPPTAPDGAFPAFDAGNPFDVALVRWAQEDIAGPGPGIDPEPFATAAKALSAQLGSRVSEAQVLERLAQLKADRAIRRFGALVAHRSMGFAFNGMTVWDIPDDEADAVGAAFARNPFVSHCYARPRTATWPYNLYGMVHARTQMELDAHVEALVAQAGGRRPQVLVSTREYKKASMRYFMEDAGPPPAVAANGSLEHAPGNRPARERMQAC